jgi:hypothetical protein
MFALDGTKTTRGDTMKNHKGFTTQEAARFSKRSKAHVGNAIRSGHLAAKKVYHDGGSWFNYLIDGADLEEWAKKGCVSTYHATYRAAINGANGLPLAAATPKPKQPVTESEAMKAFLSTVGKSAEWEMFRSGYLAAKGEV